MVISRSWSMPSSATFSIPCVSDLLSRYLSSLSCVVDPFARASRWGDFTNDLDSSYDTLFHLDSLDFLSLFSPSSVDAVLFDPPYSSRQVSEHYRAAGLSVDRHVTDASWRRRHLDLISRILRPGGLVLSFGWNSSGVGKCRGFEIVELLLVCHGASHHDTICLVERKSVV